MWVESECSHTWRRCRLLVELAGLQCVWAYSFSRSAEWNHFITDTSCRLNALSDVHCHVFFVPTFSAYRTPHELTVTSNWKHTKKWNYRCFEALKHIVKCRAKHRKKEKKNKVQMKYMKWHRRKIASFDSNRRALMKICVDCKTINT